jgi:ABC-2 type transport system ATP-binding protein
MLVATELVKRYGRVTALDGFSLTVEPAEICGLIGHNGAGKTTFVEVATGLTRPDSGSVTIAGRPPGRARHLFGLAPQEIALYLSVSLRQNLRLFGGLAGLRGRALRCAITETAEALRLVDVLDRPVGLLSGGQRRRAQAATALVHRPPLLLLDEPTAGADPDTRRALLDLVKRRARDGAAVCYTTHYLPELVQLDASLAICAAGRVIARGSQQTLLARLPGRLELAYPDGTTELITTTNPPAELAHLLAKGARPATIDIQAASLDDLYHSLAAANA